MTTIKTQSAVSITCSFSSSLPSSNFLWNSFSTGYQQLINILCCFLVPNNALRRNQGRPSSCLGQSLAFLHYIWGTAVSYNYHAFADTELLAGLGRSFPCIFFQRNTGWGGPTFTSEPSFSVSSKQLPSSIVYFISSTAYTCCLFTIKSHSCTWKKRPERSHLSKGRWPYLWVNLGSQQASSPANIQWGLAEDSSWCFCEPYQFQYRCSVRKP